MAEQMQSHVTGAEPLVVRMQRAQRMPLAGPELEQHMRLLGQAVEVAEEGLPEEAASSPQGGTSLAMATSSQAREAGEAGAPAPMAAAVPDGFMPCPVGLVGFMLKGLRQCAAISLPLTLPPPICREACTLCSRTKIVKWSKPGMIMVPCLASHTIWWAARLLLARSSLHLG